MNIYLLECQSHAAFTAAVDLARKDDSSSQVKAGLLMTLAVDKLTEALEYAEDEAGAGQQFDDADKTVRLEELAFRT